AAGNRSARISHALPSWGPSWSPALADGLDLVPAELNGHGGDVLFRVLGRAGPGNGQDRWRDGQQPGQHDLVLGHALPPGRHGHRDLPVGLLYRRPRQEDHVLLLAQVDHRLRLPVGHVEPVLYRHDRDDPLRLAELVLRHIRQADVTDLALSLELGDRADRFGQRHLRVRAVELVERYLLEPEPAQAALARLSQVFGAPVGVPAVRAGPDQAALGRDHQVVRVRVQRLGDQGLADVRTVGVGRVDEVDAKFDDPPERGDGPITVGRGTPDTRP